MLGTGWTGEHLFISFSQANWVLDPMCDFRLLCHVLSITPMCPLYSWKGKGEKERRIKKRGEKEKENDNEPAK